MAIGVTQIQFASTTGISIGSDGIQWHVAKYLLKCRSALMDTCTLTHSLRSSLSLSQGLHEYPIASYMARASLSTEGRVLVSTSVDGQTGQPVPPTPSLPNLLPKLRFGSPISAIPHVSSISPSFGNALGGVRITILGSNFGQSAWDFIGVTMNQLECTEAQWINSSAVSCITPNDASAMGSRVVPVVRTRSSGGLPGTVSANPDGSAAVLYTPVRICEFPGQYNNGSDVCVQCPEGSSPNSDNMGCTCKVREREGIGYRGGGRGRGRVY